MTTHSPSSAAGASIQVDLPVEARARQSIALLGFGLTVPWTLELLFTFAVRTVAPAAASSSSLLWLFGALPLLLLGSLAMAVIGAHRLARSPALSAGLSRWLVVLAWLGLVSAAARTASMLVLWQLLFPIHFVHQLVDGALWFVVLRACASVVAGAEPADEPDGAGENGNVAGFLRKLAVLFAGASLLGLVGVGLGPLPMWLWPLGSAVLLVGALVAFTRTWRALT